MVLKSLGPVFGDRDVLSNLLRRPVLAAGLGLSVDNRLKVAGIDSVDHVDHVLPGVLLLLGEVIAEVLLDVWVVLDLLY